MATVYSRSMVLTSQPSATTSNPFQQFNGDWNVGLMSCCDDVSQCCYAYFCWCCFMGSLAEKIGESKCSCCCVPNALAVYRMKVRTVFHIRGDSCNDYCATCCCPFCVGLQMQNELKVRGLS